MRLHYCNSSSLPSTLPILDTWGANPECLNPLSLSTLLIWLYCRLLSQLSCLDLALFQLFSLWFQVLVLQSALLLLIQTRYLSSIATTLMLQLSIIDSTSLSASASKPQHHCSLTWSTLPSLAVFCQQLRYLKCHLSSLVYHLS